MNINTKAILASTVLSAVFAGTSAMAGDNDHFAKADYPTTTETVVFQKASMQTSTVETVVLAESGRK